MLIDGFKGTEWFDKFDECWQILSFNQNFSSKHKVSADEKFFAAEN